MNTLIMIAVVGLVALAGWQLMAGPAVNRPVKVRAAAKTSNKPSSRFHAVEVMAPGGCEAARQRRGVRYLSQEAPTLPLSDCTQSECRCRYRHHQDRRAGDRRTSLDHTYHQISESIGRERRHRNDRRQQMA